MKHTLLIFLIGLLATNAVAQSYLVIKKRNKVKVAFEAGDKVKFKLYGEKFYTRQLIQGFTEDGIRFHYFDVKLKDIEEIKLVDKNARGFPFRYISSILIQVGVGYAIIDQFNQTIIRDEPFEISEPTLVVSSSLVGTGLLLKLFNRKRFKFSKNKFRLQIVSYMP